MPGHEPCQDGQWIRSAVTRYERPLILYAAQIVGDAESLGLWWEQGGWIELRVDGIVRGVEPGLPSSPDFVALWD